MQCTHSFIDPEEHKAPQKKPAATPTFTHKETATLAQRIEIMDWYFANGKNQSKTAKHFDKIYPNLRIKQPLVSSWLKEEARWRAEWADSQRSHNPAHAQRAKRTKQVEHPEVDEMLELWVAKAMRDSVYLSGELLRLKWTKFADMAGVSQNECLKLSDEC